MTEILNEIPAQRVLLLTGASGLVGSAIISHLQRFDRSRAIAGLSRQPAMLRQTPGLVAIPADLSREDLGLDDRTSRMLRNQVTEVIHCAADVKFNSTLQSSRIVNVEGTRRLLEFAARCPKLQKFGHISTLYIAGRKPGQVTEHKLHQNFGYFNVYEQSKHEAEELVCHWMERLPISIYRLSAIIGNSVTGQVTQKNFFHSLIALAPRASALPCLPIESSAPVDLIADDWCCRSLAFLFDSHFTEGAVHHLCAGLQYSLTAGELIDKVFQVIEEQTGERILRPPLGQWRDIERHRRTHSSANEGALLDLISKFLPHMALHQPFDRGATGEILDCGHLSPPLPAAFVERVIRRTVTPSLQWNAAFVPKTLLNTASIIADKDFII